MKMWEAYFLIRREKSAAKPRFAILDWGIGGMDFYRIFKSYYPEAGVSYFSDAGAVPYGKQRRTELNERLSIVISYLRDQGVTHLVVACNAMSTVLPYSVHNEGFHVTGVIEPAISTTQALKGERIGIVGGRRTILSGVYGKVLRQSFPTVIQRIAQPLSAMIENGEKDTPIFHETLKRIMVPLKKTDILILACTHYPAAAAAFEALAPSASIINPSFEAFRWVNAHWLDGINDSDDIFCTTGNPEAMRNAAYSAFGVKVGEIVSISL